MNKYKKEKKLFNLIEKYKIKKGSLLSIDKYNDNMYFVYYNNINLFTIGRDNNKKNYLYIPNINDKIPTLIDINKAIGIVSKETLEWYRSNRIEKLYDR